MGLFIWLQMHTFINLNNQYGDIMCKLMVDGFIPSGYLYHSNKVIDGFSKDLFGAIISFNEKLNCAAKKEGFSLAVIKNFNECYSEGKY